MLVNVNSKVYADNSNGLISTYKVKVHIETLGMWLNGVKVVVFHEGTGECKVYKPSHLNPRTRSFDSDIDFDTAHAFWNLIADSCVDAVQESQNISLERVKEDPA